jgi:hypothetical protein
MIENVGNLDWIFSLGWGVITMILWELIWKGLALYRAGKKQQPIWFVLLLIINSVGILPIIYLIISRDKAKSKRKKK